MQQQVQEQVRQILSIYCLCDDFLRAWGQTDAPQAKMTTAQVMTVALVAVTLFDGNQEKSRRFLQEHGYIPKMLSKDAVQRCLQPKTARNPGYSLASSLSVAGRCSQADERQSRVCGRQFAGAGLPVPVCRCRFATTFAFSGVVCILAREGTKRKTKRKTKARLRREKASEATLPARSVTSTD